jgi:hypothetical protein
MASEQIMKRGRKIIDLTGQRFGRLQVLSFAGNINKGSLWLCKCDCGNKKIIRATNLKQGTQSCGCLLLEVKKMNRTVAFDHKRLYNVWAGIKTRCYNANHPRYNDWGGRGITMCEEWKNSFGNFYNWAMANGYDEHAERGQCTLDRIDNDGNYEPLNCRWIGMKEQCTNRNRRNT